MTASRPTRPEGRLSLAKLRAYAAEINRSLREHNASTFVEVRAEYGYYVLANLTPAQYAFRLGESREESGISGHFRRGLSAKSACEMLTHFYVAHLPMAPEVAS
jgi:hypothetical protein